MKQSQLNSMTITELQNLNRMIVDTLKAKKRSEARNVKRALLVGSTVSVDHPRLAGKTYIVTEIRKTRCVVRDYSNRFGTSYVVPMNLVATA